jgi:glycosyltransferase involved in cell wall biosynthesis
MHCGVGSRAAIRAAYGIPQDAVVILVYGDLTAPDSANRKGVDGLLLACQEQNFPQQTVLLIAGAQGSRAKVLLAGPVAMRLKAEGRLIERNWFQSTQEEYEVFAASDIVWMGYRNHYYTSGVIIQAGAAELPVIACEQGMIGWVTRRHSLGPVVNTDDPAAMAAIVASLVRSPELRRTYGLAGKHLAAQHTSAAFWERIFDTIMGLQAPDLVQC